MDIHVAIPALDKLVRWVTQKMFLDAYQVSDAYYWKHHALGTSWRKLGNYLEYGTHFATIYSNIKPPKSMIAIRAQGDQRFAKVIVSVVAEGQVASYQDTVVLYDVTATPTIFALPSIPLRECWVARNGIGLSYQRVRVQIIELTDKDNRPISPLDRIPKEYFSLSYADLLNGDLCERWGACWHIGELKWQQQMTCERVCARLSRSGDLMPTRWLYRILSTEWVKTLLFWSQNLGTARQLRAAIAEVERVREDYGERHAI